MHASQLPGGLGTATNECLRPDETIIMEVHVSAGEGLVLTDLRLIKVAAGFAKAKSLKGRRSGHVSFNMIRGLKIIKKPSDDDSVYYWLELDSEDLTLPDWLRQTTVVAKRIEDVFRLYGILITRLAELGLSGQLYRGAAIRAVCPHCDAPYVVSREE
jgi:hypothetical protein